MSKRQFVFQVGLLIIVGLLSCAQSRAQSADCVPNAPVTTSGKSTTIGPVSFPSGTDHCKFRFSLHAFEFGASATLPCTISVTATTVSQKTVQARLNGTLLTPLPTGSVAAPVLYSGFKQIVVYTVTVPFSGACQISSGEHYSYKIFATVGTTNLNPRIARCETNCSLSLTGYWPFGSDPFETTGDSTSDFFLVNVTPTTDPDKEVTFCSWLPPLNSDPNNPPIFSPSKGTVPVKFQVSKVGCPPATLSDTVADAQVIISVARIEPLQIMNPLPPGSSRTLPVFSFDAGGLLYTYTLNVGTYPCGLFSVTATFLTSNTTAETTFFKIPCQ